MSGPRAPYGARMQGGAVAAPWPARAGSRAWRRTVTLPDSRLVDGLLRGRTWIVLLGILLTGIVALNVALLRLNTNITSNAQQIEMLKRDNGRMQAQTSRLSSIDRVERVAGAQGMVMPQPSEVQYLTTYPRPTFAQSRAAVHAAGLGG